MRETRAFMKAGCKRRGHDFHINIIFKGIRLLLGSWPMPPLWPGVIVPHCLYVLHTSCRLSAYPETAHHCAPHSSVASHTARSPSFAKTSPAIRAATWKTTDYLPADSGYSLHLRSHVPLSQRTLVRVVPFMCTSWAWSSQALLAPVVARPFLHPCPGPGFSYPPTRQHKQVLAVFIHTEWCMSLRRKCVYEPHKSSTTFEWSPCI